MYRDQTSERGMNMEVEKSVEPAVTSECSRLRNAVRRANEGVHLPVALFQAGFTNDEIRELFGREPDFARPLPIVLTHPWPY